MQHLFDAAAVDEVKGRVARLRPESERLWGRMTAAQMLAHCAASMECAVGDARPPRQLLGRAFGRFGRPGIVDEKPLPRNVPSAPGLLARDERRLDVERQRLDALIDRFAAGGPAGRTTHPHSFFGQLTPEEWARWMYRHLDHHLRQFQV